MCYRRGAQAMDNRGKIAVPGYPISANMGSHNQAVYTRDKIREVLRWYTGYDFRGNFPLIPLTGASSDGHSHQNYLVILPEKKGS